MKTILTLGAAAVFRLLQPGGAVAAAGAFALAPDRKDATLVVTLPPGGSTVEVTGAGNTTGTALVEIYDLAP